MEEKSQQQQRTSAEPSAGPSSRRGADAVDPFAGPSSSQRAHPVEPPAGQRGDGVARHHRRCLLIDVPTRIYSFDSDLSSRWRRHTTTFPPKLSAVFFNSADRRSAAFLYAPLVSRSYWNTTPDVRPRFMPVYVLRGEVRFALMDAELWNPATHRGWQRCPPLPPEFATSPTAFNVALVNGRLLFVSDMYSGAVSRLDLGVPVDQQRWSQARELRPPGLSALSATSVLIARRRGLLLVILYANVLVFDVDPNTMEIGRRLSEMPAEMFRHVFRSSEMTTCICLGIDGFVYVINNSNDYAGCFCDVDDGDCRWRRLPVLPKRSRSTSSAFCTDLGPAAWVYAWSRRFMQTHRDRSAEIMRSFPASMVPS